MLSGYGCSGKTSRATEIQALLTDRNRHVVIVTEQRLDTEHSAVVTEKAVHSSVRSEAQRLLQPNTLVIVDGLNDVKGFRYELYCIARAAKTPHVVLQTAVALDQCQQWDEARGNLYGNKLRIEELSQRYEPPDNRNRWDCPLFTLTPDDPLPLEDIEAALFERRAPPPRLSTLPQRLSETNFLHDLDRVTQEIVTVGWASTMVAMAFC